MTRAALALLLAATPALADLAPSASRMTLLPGNGECFAIVEIDNRAGVYNRDEVIDLPEGPLVIHYKTNGGHNAEDFDEVTVLAVPAGVKAFPMYIALPDGDQGHVCLRVPNVS